MRRRIGRGGPLLVVALLAFVATACQTTTTRRPRAGEATKPQAFFWEAVSRDGGGKLFLLGSVHIGDGRELALGPKIEADWNEAQELVVELDLTAPSPIDAVESTNRHGLLPEPKTLQQVVRAETYKQVAAYMKRRAYSMDRVDQMRPWMVALVVQDLEYGAAGLRAENGVDAVLLRRAKGRKPIVALETLDEQMAAFAGLPDSLQESWLEDVLRESEQLLVFTREMLRVWEAGDDARMLELVFPAAESDADQLQFYERMYWSRNRVMTDRLLQLAADGKPRFVVIGTGHLLGPRGIPELLAQRGFEVRRLGSARVIGAGVAPAPAPATTPTPATPAPRPAPATTTTPPTPAPIEPASPPLSPEAIPAPTDRAPAPAPSEQPVAPPPAPAETLQAPAAPPTGQPVAPAPTPAPARSEHERWLEEDAPGSLPAPVPVPVDEPAAAPAPAPEPEPKPAKRRRVPSRPGGVGRLH